MSHGMLFQWCLSYNGHAFSREVRRTSAHVPGKACLWLEEELQRTAKFGREFWVVIWSLYVGGALHSNEHEFSLRQPLKRPQLLHFGTVLGVASGADCLFGVLGGVRLDQAVLLQ